MATWNTLPPKDHLIDVASVANPYHDNKDRVVVNLVD